MKQNTKSVLFIAVVAAALFAVVGLWVHREWRIDRCYDRGGIWHDDTNLCEGARE